MKLVPCSHAKAKAFIAKHHRHNDPSIGAVFCVALESDDGELLGVAMAGIPKARKLMDGKTLEVTRVAVVEGSRNANSMLYGACARAAEALGYERLITYTLQTESGSSLRGAGWNIDNADAGGGKAWQHWGLEQEQASQSFEFVAQKKHPTGPKYRWVRRLR